MTLATLVGGAAGASCGGPPPAPAPVKLDVPAPAASTRESMRASARRAKPPTERARLETACFAEPWLAADAQYAAKQLSKQEDERLRVLLAPDSGGCRDVHPDLPPGRFASGYRIPLSECHYGIARLYFEARRWADAARWFRRVAFEHAETDVGIFAAQLYLESLNVLGASGSSRRTECFELLADDAERVACVYCAKPDNLEACSTLQRIRFDVGRLLVTGAIPASGVAAKCSSDERAVAGRCERLPPMVPADCEGRREP